MFMMGLLNHGAQESTYNHAAMVQLDPRGTMAFFHRTSNAKLDPQQGYPAGFRIADYITVPLTPARATAVLGGSLILGPIGRHLTLLLLHHSFQLTASTTQAQARWQTHADAKHAIRAYCARTTDSMHANSFAEGWSTYASSKLWRWRLS